MLIEINSDIFDGTNFRDLNYLIQICFRNNRYSLYADISKIKDKNLFKRLDKDDIDLLEQSFNNIIQDMDVNLGNQNSISNPNYLVSHTRKRGNFLSLNEAISFFSQPVLVILENNLNDYYFIQSIIKYFDDGLIKKHIDNNWIKFENAGGCTNVRNVIKAQLNNYIGVTEPKERFLRCFVLLDSDRTHPNQPLNYKHLENEEYFITHSISYHILHKRMMENYIPKEVFQNYRVPHNVNWVNSFNFLDEVQRDYFNISKGFEVTSKTDLPEHIYNLYENLSEQNFNNLTRGIVIPNFKTEFPKNFIESHYVYYDTLMEITKHQINDDELQTIVDKIRDLL